MRTHADAIAQDLILRYYETLDGTLGAQNNMARTLHCSALHCSALHCTALRCAALLYIILLCTALPCPALLCAALHWTALQALLLRKTCANNLRNFQTHQPTTSEMFMQQARAPPRRRNPLGVLGVLGVGPRAKGGRTATADPTGGTSIHRACMRTARACARDRLRR
jgi:hypothetical protein